MKNLLKTWNRFKEVAFILLIISSLLIVLFYFLLKVFRPQFYTSHINFFKDLYLFGLAILSPGIFAALLKYFQFLGIFETEITKIIKSSQFENTLQNTINQTVYSTEFLSRQKDLDKIWKNSTLCLFHSYFPDISTKVDQKLTNELFKRNNLSHYYKNYNIKIFITLIDNSYLQIEELSEYTLIRPDDSDFSFEFEYSIPKVEDNGKTSITINSMTINEEEHKQIDQTENAQTEDIVDVTYKYLIGQRIEYLVKHKITLVYPIERDNEFHFFCQRILEDLTVELYIDSQLNHIFVPMNNEKMKLDEIKKGIFSFSHRNILLPNSGFRTYFFKKNTHEHN